MHKHSVGKSSPKSHFSPFVPVDLLLESPQVSRLSSSVNLILEERRGGLLKLILLCHVEQDVTQQYRQTRECSGVKRGTNEKKEELDTFMLIMNFYCLQNCRLNLLSTAGFAKLNTLYTKTPSLIKDSDVVNVIKKSLKHITVGQLGLGLA